MTLGTLVVVPAYGLVEMTRETVVRLLPEDVDLLVIDNQGDYRRVGRERVVTPGRNIRWLGACNLGLRYAADRRYSHTLLLNNDVHTSPGFVATLVDAARDRPGRRPVGLAGPLQSGGDVAPTQELEAYTDAYEGVGEDRDAAYVHGAAMLVSRACYAALGPMDVAQLPHGWATDIEYGMLARRAGFRCVVAVGSHMQHFTRATVMARGASRGAHVEEARRHVARVLSTRYGPNWQGVLGFDFGWGDPA